MRLDSVLSFKAEIRARVAASRVESLLDAEAPIDPMADVALGIAGIPTIAGAVGDQDFLVAVRVLPGQEAIGEEIRASLNGEADVRVIRVQVRPPVAPQAGVPSWLNEARRPLEPGVAISPKGSNWVGTLFGFGRRRSDGSLVFLSNSHVLGAIDGVSRGTPVLQPFGGEPIGVTAEDRPILTFGNLADIQVGSLRSVALLEKYNFAVGALGKVVPVVPSDLGRHATKIGRTTGVRFGTCTAVDVDNLPVAYGATVRRFDNQVEFAGSPNDFSAGGDSGSMICWRDSHEIPCLLFAGGTGDAGEDRTYGNRVLEPLADFGIDLL